MPINNSATLHAWNRAVRIPSHIIPGIALRRTKLSIWLYAYCLDVCVNANCWNDKPLRPEIRFWCLQVADMFRFDHQRCFARGGRCMGDRYCLLATTAAEQRYSQEKAAEAEFLQLHMGHMPFMGHVKREYEQNDAQAFQR